MSVARILIKQRERLFRFVKAETSSDGSLIVLLDRDPRSQKGGYDMDATGQFVPTTISDDKPMPSTRFSIHTSGEVHRYSGGRRVGTIHIDPIYSLSSLNVIGVISIPHISSLDLYLEGKHPQDVLATLEFPDDIESRINFGLEIGPRPQSPASYGLSLDYELFSLVVRAIGPIGQIPTEMSEHFICGMVNEGAHSERQATPAAAELEFYRRAHPGGAPVYREEGGAYVVHAAVEMAYAPKLTVRFDRDDLKIEQIDFGVRTQPSHKVRFWILDKAGRNKTDDLRVHIVDFVLDARI